MFKAKNNGKSDSEKGIRLIKRVKRVYNSCTTLEQLAMADSYARLAVNRLLKLLPKYTVDTYEIYFKKMRIRKYKNNLPIW